MNMQTVETPLRSIQGDFTEVPPGLGSMAVMGVDGDTKYIWDKDQPAEVEAARATFEKLVNENRYTAYKVNANGDQGEGPIREFDPEEERYIFAPAMQGG